MSNERNQNKQPTTWSLNAILDGMGGVAAGDEASKKCGLAITHLLHDLHIDKQGNYIVKDKLVGDHSIGKDIHDLARYINSIAQEVYRSLPRGTGTTFTSLLTIGNASFILHAGDSRLYRRTYDPDTRKHRLLQITRDESHVQDEYDASRRDTDAVRRSQDKNIITNWLGTKKGLKVIPIDLNPEEGILIVCDGIPSLFGDQSEYPSRRQRETPIRFEYVVN